MKSTLAKLTLGEADAVVVYVSDVKGAGDKVMGITIPAAQNVLATYPIAAVKASKNLAAAEAFVDEIATGSGQQVLGGGRVHASELTSAAIQSAYGANAVVISVATISGISYGWLARGSVRSRRRRARSSSCTRTATRGPARTEPFHQ